MGDTLPTIYHSALYLLSFKGEGGWRRGQVKLAIASWPFFILKWRDSARALLKGANSDSATRKNIFPIVFEFMHFYARTV